MVYSVGTVFEARSRTFHRLIVAKPISNDEKCEIEPSEAASYSFQGQNEQTTPGVTIPPKDPTPRRNMRAPFQILAIPYSPHPMPRFCVLQRADSGQWQFVAGGGEDNETPAEAATREIAEETQVRAANLLRLDSICSIPASIISEHCRAHWPSDTYVIPEYAFAFECLTEIRISNEHTTFEWLDYDTAMARLTWDSNKTALYELNCRLNAKTAGVC